MNPVTIALIISLVEEGIKEYPAIAADLQSIFSNGNPQPADWQALRDKVLAKSYADYVPATALAAGSPAAETAAVIALPAAQNALGGQASASAPASAPYLADGTPNPAHQS